MAQASMSNHTGGYLLNDVLRLLDTEKVFELMGKPKAQRLVLDIIELSRKYDCNSYEILDEIGDRLGICTSCLQPAEGLKDGFCESCRAASPWLSG